GGIDVKYINSVTLAYNKFNNCKKTGLVGGDNKNHTKNITFHHNYYYNVESRLPLGRQANMHIYNNYYESCGTCQDIRANAFVFSEANYFDGCTTAQKVSTDSTYPGTVIKSYNDYYNGSSKQNTTQATKVNSRTQSLTGNCKPDGSTDYTNFDTNSTLFYYSNGASNVTLLHKNTDVPAYCKSHSGAGVLKSAGSSSGGTVTPPEPTPSEDWTNKLTETFSSSKTIQQSSTPNPTSAGIYYYTDAADNSNNNVTISGGMLHINDTSDKTTWGYYNFDSATIKSTQSGKVRISVDFIPPKDSSKWTVIRFLDGDNDVWIRTDGNKKLGYTINGEKEGADYVVHAVDTAAMEKNKVYTVVLIIDYDKNEASVSINGGTSVKLTGYSANLSIYGLAFMTAGTDATRSYTIDNIKVDWAN
ncbi:MAG: hypothetical protein K2N65_00525, partial [Anaeroplasmataceae bacterium]|nr:hypothetical protein [Anaeroplasmataceae bacterium]